MNVNEEFPSHNIDTLKSDPNVTAIYHGRMMKGLSLYKVFDNYNTDIPSLLVEQGDDVLITAHDDGTSYVNFMSIYENTYHYRALIEDKPGTVEVIKELYNV